MDRTLGQGMTGRDVRALQDVLNFHVRRGEPLHVDGNFGPKTRARVLEFQKSNGLVADGLVGPHTRAVLFAVNEMPLTVLFMPRLQLPSLTVPGGGGIRPLLPIPPLQLPTLLPPLQPKFSRPINLFPGNLVPLPTLGEPADALSLKIIVPARSDPDDPTLRSYKEILELIDELPVDSRFRAFIIGLVPNPTKKISAPSVGFQWGGIAPLFNPFNPTGFGVKGNAAFSVRVTDGGGGLPYMVFEAWGDGKFFLDFSSGYGRARPAVQAQGQLMLGLKGVF